jgi:hypothetical protein
MAKVMGRTIRASTKNWVFLPVAIVDDDREPYGNFDAIFTP